MTLRRLKWLAALAPLVFLIGVDVVRHIVRPDLLHDWPGQLAILGIVLIGILLFTRAVFGIVERTQAGLGPTEPRAARPPRGRAAATGELSLETVLQKAVDGRESSRCPLRRAFDPPRRSGIGPFITRAKRGGVARIGPPPQGHGLLGVVLNEGQRLRLPDLTRDPLSVGFPPHHPPMTPLLAVPRYCWRRHREPVSCGEGRGGGVQSGRRGDLAPLCYTGCACHHECTAAPSGPGARYHRGARAHCSRDA